MPLRIHSVNIFYYQRTISTIFLLHSLTNSPYYPQTNSTPLTQPPLSILPTFNTLISVDCKQRRWKITTKWPTTWVEGKSMKWWGWCVRILIKNLFLPWRYRDRFLIDTPPPHTQPHMRYITYHYIHIYTHSHTSLLPQLNTSTHQEKPFYW